MKKFILLFVLINIAILSNSFEKIDSFGARVEEKTLINGEWREKSYVIKIEYPDKVIKEIVEPELNRGEKVLYIENKKWVYYPLFGESFEEEVDGDENYLLQALKAIKQGESKIEEVDGEVAEIELDSNITLMLRSYKKVNGLKFPEEIIVYDNAQLLSKIYFSEIELNEVYEDEVFELGI